jgi:ankyrin repeat protein
VISKERLGVVKLLAEHLVLAQLTSSDKFGLNVAATAVAFGSVDCVSFLLLDRDLPHHQAVDLLLDDEDAYVSDTKSDFDADPHKRVTMSLLQIAALRGDATIIRLLCRINPGAVNAVSSMGMTALHFAIAAHSPLSCIDALLAHGADSAVNCGRSSSEFLGCANAFDLAGWMYTDALEVLTMHAPRARNHVLLSDAKQLSASSKAAALADSKLSTDKGATAKEGPGTSVFEAAASGNMPLVSQALKSGFDVESRNAAGHSLLMIACAFGQRAVAKRVMKHGADMDAVDGNGRTAAHIAIQSGRQEICEYLVACGASKDLPDASGVTVEFLLANPESAATYGKQPGRVESDDLRRSSGVMTRRSAVLVIQRFALDVGQSNRARRHLRIHSSCAGCGRAISFASWPKRASYVIHRHRNMYKTIVMLQCFVRSHQARYAVCCSQRYCAAWHCIFCLFVLIVHLCFGISVWRSILTHAGAS